MDSLDSIVGKAWGPHGISLLEEPGSTSNDSGIVYNVRHVHIRARAQTHTHTHHAHRYSTTSNCGVLPSDRKTNGAVPSEKKTAEPRLRSDLGNRSPLQLFTKSLRLNPST